MLKSPFIRRTSTGRTSLCRQMKIGVTREDSSYPRKKGHRDAGNFSFFFLGARDLSQTHSTLSPGGSDVLTSLLGPQVD